jgi:hypothetical protein
MACGGGNTEQLSDTEMDAVLAGKRLEDVRSPKDEAVGA